MIVIKNNKRYDYHILKIIILFVKKVLEENYGKDNEKITTL